MALNITPLLLDQINRVMADRAALRLLPIADVLQLLIEAGFASARFYDVAHDISAGEQALFLSCSRQLERDAAPVGLKIPFSATSLGRNIQGNKPVVECLAGEDIPAAYQPWVNALNLEGMPWADVPVRLGDVLVAVLALSWHGSRNVLTPADECSLSNIASIIAGHIEHVTRKKIEHFVDRILELPHEAPDAIDLLDTCALLTLNAVDGKLASIFEYNWATNRLIKLLDKPSLPAQQQRIYAESYQAGSYLTGRAFRDKSYRHVVDLRALIDDKRVLVNGEVLTCHEEIVGPARSLLYGLLGENDKTYLLRIINRADQPALPFVSLHHRVFTGLCSKLSDVVEYAIVRSRLRRLSLVAHATISDISNLHSSVLAVQDALKVEQIPGICILVRAGDSQHFTFTHFYNKSFKDAFGSSYIPWQQQGFYNEIMTLDETVVLDLDIFSERHDPKHVVGHMYAAGIKRALVVPVKAACHSGVIIAPITDMTKDALRRLPRSVKELIDAYAGILGSAIEASDSYLTTENARRLIGQIGHEMETPIAQLGQNAIATALAARQIPGATAEVIEELAGYEQVITGSMQHIGALMDVAITMATETRGVLSLHFQPLNILKVMKEAASEAQQMVPMERRPDQRYASDLERLASSVDFEFNAACKAVPELVGDPDILRKVFVNLFRNAIKYSLPRYKRKRMVVSVNAEPQANLVVLTVENWGIGVPEDKRELIFRAFQRGDVHDELKAIRGMGLGLYIARRFLAAHRGTICCRKSEATLDDPVRVKRMEGWLTVFEVRLPYGLPTGPFEHEWGV